MTGTVQLKSRFERFRQALADRGLHAAIISSKIHFVYLLGFKTESESQLLVPASTSNAPPIIFTSPLEEEIVKSQLPFPEIVLNINTKTLSKKIVKAVSDRRYREVQYELKPILVPEPIVEPLFANYFQKQVKTIFAPNAGELYLPGFGAEQAVKAGIEANKFVPTECDGRAVLIPRTTDQINVAEACNEYHISTIGLEFEQITHQQFLNLHAAIKRTSNFKEESLKFIDITDDLTRQRIIKDADEIEYIKKACTLADKGFAAAAKAIQEYRTEDEAQAEAEYAMKRAGSEQPAFETIVVSGLRTGFPHGHASDKRIEKGDLVTVDIGATFKGYCSDLTRTVVAGHEGVTDRVKILRTVNRAHRLALEAIIDGKSWSEPDKVVRKFFQEQGMLENYVHSLGHGVGVEVHEAPWVNFRQTEPEKIFRPGMTFTIEPGVYIPGKGGARTENTYLLTEKGLESLCFSPIEEYHTLPKMIHN